MGFRSLAKSRGCLGGVAVIAGAACLACSDLGRNRHGGPGNPLTPPVACTTIGCEDGLKVELRPASGWPAGEYRFQIKADTFEVTCRGSLPLRDCIASPDAGARNVTCDKEGLVQIFESGCALPAAAHAFPGVSFDSRLRPRTVAISVTRNQQLVGRAEIVPSFQKVRPNGPDCPPACDVAEAVLDLRF